MTDVIENVEEILVKVEGPKTILGQQIYVYVPFATDGVHGIVKPDGITLEVDLNGVLKSTLNLVNGEGADSLVQKYSGEIDDTHFENLSTGDSAAIFGEANLNYGNRNLMFGKLNAQRGANSIIGGLYNGHGTSLNMSNSIVVGDNIKGVASASAIFGAYAEVACLYAFTSGFGNKVYSQGTSAIGYYLVVGKNGVTNGYEGQFATGCWNAIKDETGAHEVLYMVGNGTSDTNRSNAFEVLRDGSAIVYPNAYFNYINAPAGTLISKQMLENKVASVEEKFKDYVPLQKADKTGVYFVTAYSKNSAGMYNYYGIIATPEPSGEKLIIRSKLGRAQIQDPEDDMDIANKRYVEGAIDDAIQKLVGLAPEELNTLEELAEHIKSHADEYAVILDAIVKKADTDFVKQMLQTVDVVTSQDDGFDILYASDAEITIPIKGSDVITVDVDENNEMIEIRMDPTYVQYINRAARAIVTPLTTPVEPVIPIIGTNNAQQNVELGEGITIKDGKLVSTKNYPKFVRLF